MNPRHIVNVFADLNITTDELEDHIDVLLKEWTKQGNELVSCSVASHEGKFVIVLVGRRSPIEE